MVLKFVARLLDIIEDQIAIGVAIMAVIAHITPEDLCSDLLLFILGGPHALGNLILGGVCKRSIIQTANQDLTINHVQFS